MAKNNTIATMVKINFYIAICLMLLGCSRHNKTDNNVVFVQNNDFLLYMNYSEPEEYSFPFFHYQTVSDFPLDAKKQENKIPITGNDSLLVRKILDNFMYLYYKDHGEYELSYRVDTVRPRNLFFCGKISVVFDRDLRAYEDFLGIERGISGADSVNSFLVLTERSDFDVFGNIMNTVFRQLYLLNFKNNKLTSVVEVSRFWGDIDYASSSQVVSYFINDMYVSQLYYSFSESPKTLKEILIPVNEISDIVKFNEDSKFNFLYYSAYRIDENGFVELN